MNCRRIFICGVLLLASSELSRAQTPTYVTPPGSQRGDPYIAQPGAVTSGGFRFAPPTAPQQPPPPTFAQPAPAFQQPPPVASSTPPAPPLATAPPVAAPAPNTPANGEFFEEGQVVATVGNQFILAGDVMAQVNQILEPNIAKIPKNLSPAEQEAVNQQLAEARDKYSRVIVQQMIDAKLLYLEFERNLTKNVPADKQPDIRKNMTRKIGENFDQQLADIRKKIVGAKQEEVQDLIRRDQICTRLALLMQEKKVETMADLDAVLRTYGTSLERQKKAYGEYQLGRQQVFSNVKANKEVSHLDMLNYYRDHADEFAKQARARFEILTVRFDRFPTKDAAWQALAAMGNDVFYGAAFAAVAKRGSQEPNAEQGGQYDWTTRGSLASSVIDTAIFTYEPGKLSPILEDDRGFHIVRVLEREEAGAVPFVDAQVKIKEAIVLERRNVAYKQFLDGLRTKTTIWTIYDPPAVAREPRDSSPR